MEVTKVPIEEVAQATATVEALTRALVAAINGDVSAEVMSDIVRALGAAAKAIDSYYTPMALVQP